MWIWRIECSEWYWWLCSCLEKVEIRLEMRVEEFDMAGPMAIGASGTGA